MQPDPGTLLEKIGIANSLVGLYDAPDAAPFEPVVRIEEGEGTCVFAFYDHWMKGTTLHLTGESYGCRGAGSCLFGVATRSPEEMVSFLVDKEGLKGSRDVMRRWIERRRLYRPAFGSIFIGPLRPGQYEFLKTVTFFVNPDQLAALLLGANYDSGPDDPPPVLAPFGSGCSQLLPLFADPGVSQAIIGATDIAMRQWLPPEIVAFTVTRPMFERLCKLDESSFLHKPFLKRLREARAKA
ncbi:MAG: DUF169 domain-containing protein [Thermoanaerobaculaceae bacterium]|jgi:hypothetical protein